MNEYRNEYFKEEELIKIVQELIQHPSENPPGLEESVAFYVQELLETNGIPTEMSWGAPGRPNVYARLKGNQPGPTIIYNGHLDVVPAGPNWTDDPYKGVIKEGKVYGRGSADMKSGVASMIYAAIILKRMGQKFPGELLLFFNSDEESTNIGMKQFIKDGIDGDYAIISEPTHLDICLGHRGCARYRVRTRGVAGHNCIVTDPDNALYKMAKIITALEELSLTIKKRVDPIMGPSSLTVSQIKGGVAAGIVPDFCQIEIDRRTLPGETQDEVQKEIDKCISQVAEKNSFTYELENYLFLPASSIDKSHPLVSSTYGVASTIRKKNIEVTNFKATCEAQFLSVEKGIPTIIFGPGGLEQAHIVDEYVDIDEVIDASLIFINLILQGIQAEEAH